MLRREWAALAAFYTAAALAQGGAPAMAGLPTAGREAAAAIDGEKIRAHTRFLSLDLLEGRGPGTRGDALAAEYIATQFALSGLEPAGDNGGYFQRVPLLAVHTEEEKTHLALRGSGGEQLALAYGTEIVVKDQTGAAVAELDAPIVFAGYGIDAPEYGWNDYAGVDLKGKIALVIVNEPPSGDERFFAGKALTYYGRWTYKYEEAARRGAVGVLLIHRTDLASYGWEVVRNSQAVEKSYLEGDPLATLRAAAWLEHGAAARLFALEGLGDLDAAIEAAGRRGFRAVELKARLQGHIESRVRRYASANVVARLRGSRGSEQAVLYTAHYDHLGMDPSAPGDKIYNGAADNATGCAMLLEMARAAAMPGLRPPHGFYFVAVTAEEQGLLGSQYLGAHPPIPAAQFALGLNFDMVLPLGVPLSATMTGAERLNFWPTVQRAARAYRLRIEPDAEPGAGFYYRSDHFSLARVGIPAFSIDEGRLFEGHDAAWGHRQFAAFEAQRYHQPADEYQPDWDFRADAKLARFGLTLGWLASARRRPVAWLPGDPLGALRNATSGAR